MMYLVNVSGGLTSFEALRRCLDRYGKEQTHAYFADTKQEDPDLYRFLDDQEPCSLILKREAMNKVISSRYAPGTYTQVFGYEWSEIDRMSRLEKDIAPEKAWFPLAEKPYIDKCHISNFLESIGIKVPRLYELQFSHNNCGGSCVKAGQAHWAHLYFTLPERYALWEGKEEEIRQYLEKDISILKDRRGGQSKPMTLKAFRLRLEAGDTNYDKSDWGGCGCFAPVAQLRMDDWLAEAEVAI